MFTKVSSVILICLRIQFLDYKLLSFCLVAFLCLHKKVQVLDVFVKKGKVMELL